MRAFLEAHDIIVREMRDNAAAPSEGPAPLDEARALAAFWNDVLVAYAPAEGEALFLLSRSVDDPAITRSANLVESEHKPIGEGIARYNRNLQAVEQGQAQTNELVAIARDIRSCTSAKRRSR